MYRAETEGEEKEALRKLRERWGTVYPRVVVHREHGAYALLAFLRHPKPIRRYLYPAKQLWRVSKEIKRRTKVVAVEKLLHSVLSKGIAAIGTSVMGLCGSTDGKLPRGLDTLHALLWHSSHDLQQQRDLCHLNQHELRRGF